MTVDNTIGSIPSTNVLLILEYSSPNYLLLKIVIKSSFEAPVFTENGLCSFINFEIWAFVKVILHKKGQVLRKSILLEILLLFVRFIMTFNVSWPILEGLCAFPRSWIANYIYIYTHMCTNVNIYIYTYIHIDTHVCVYIWVCVWYKKIIIWFPDEVEMS